MIKALIFDLDNTLIDRRRAFREMLFRRLREFTGDEELIRAMVSDILVWDRNGEVPRLQVFMQWADKYHMPSDAARTLDMQWSAESGSTAFLYEDVRRTLTILKKKYKLAVLTNGNAASQRRKLQTIQICDLLDFSLVSGEFAVSKPDPEIFRYVCRQINAEPEECIYIGDSYRIDVLGARSAGLHAVYIDRTGSPHDDAVTIHQISDLLSIL